MFPSACVRPFSFWLNSILIILLFAVTPAGAQSVLEEDLGSLTLIGCSASGGSINITGTGNIHANKAYFNSETTLEEIDLRFNVRIDGLSGTGNYSFGIGKSSTLAGTMVKFHGTMTECLISIYRLNGTSPIFATQIPLSFDLVPGVDYKIRIGKRVRQLVMEIYPSDSSNYFYNDSLTYPTPFWGLLWGTPFIGCESGTIAITDFSLTTPFSASPRLAVWGDSFIEGSSLSEATQRYVSLIKDSIGHDNISIMGRGGETSMSMSSRFSKESRWFSGSRYALVAIGVNDNNFSSWKTNMEKHIDTLKQHNIIPIIATLSPRADRLPYIAQVNDWIRNVYNGAYIDAGKPLSSTGTYWEAGMGNADSIHPSASGHQAIYDRIKIEAPYLFRDAAAFHIDYVNETTFENVSASLEYSEYSNFSTATAGNLLSIPIAPEQTLFFRDTLGTSGIHILYEVLSAPKRPAPPTNPVTDAIALTFDWTNNPDFMNIPDYEFSINSGVSWTTCFEKPIDHPGSSSIQLRVKATASGFKSTVLHFELSDLLAARQDELRVYPNPFSEKLIFENISEETEAMLYSADGRMVTAILLNAMNATINTEALDAGFYFLTLRNGSSGRTIKLIKK